MDPKCPPPMGPLPPAPRAAGSITRASSCALGGWWCSSREPLGSRIRSAASADKAGEKEGGMSLGPRLLSPNSQPSAHKEGQSRPEAMWSLMAGTRSQVPLANSLTPRGSPNLLSAPHLGLGMSHPEGSDRLSQASAWPARPVQAGQPEAPDTGWQGV